jgi:hypothetical protein
VVNPARTFLLASIYTVYACAQEPDTGEGPAFEVVGSSPEDGADDVNEAVVPEVRFSTAANEDTCNAQTVRLDAIDAEGQVLSPIETTLSFSSGGEKIQIAHTVGLHHGFTYGITVSSGATSTDEGCTSANGDAVSPFFSRFTVP